MFDLVSFFDPLFKKSASQILFVVKKNTAFSANHRAVCEYFVKNGKNHKLAVFSPTPLPQAIEIELKKHSIKCYSSYSVPYLLYLWRTGLVFISHSVRDAYISNHRENRTIINYWHGATFKKIESLMHNIDPRKKELIEQNANLYNYLISSSRSDQKLMAQSFCMPLDKVLPIGLPRYDLFLNKMQKFKFSSNIDNLYDKLLEQHKKVIIYAPTFRETTSSPLQKLTTADYKRLNQFLHQKDLYLLIRPHYYDKFKMEQAYSNLSMISHQEYSETNLLLARASLLIVDYSSTWIDYLLLNRPIVFFYQDLEHYIENERGLNHETEFLPGCHTHTIDELTQAITRNLEQDMHREKRQEVTDFFHDYSREQSCTQRLIESIPELKALF